MIDISTRKLLFPVADVNVERPFLGREKETEGIDPYMKRG
jgi:hypothetical protein